MTTDPTPHHPSAEPAAHLAFLDEIEGEEALAWVRARNAHAEEVLAGTSRYAELRDDVAAILDSTAKIPAVAERAGHLYNFWTDADHERGLWRRTTWQSYRDAEPRWEILLDLDALAAAEGEAWVWHGAQLLMPAATRALVTLSRGGSDADVTREFDVEAKRFVDGGFARPEAKGSMAWADTSGDAVLVATDFGPGTLTDSGYPRTVRRLPRGTNLADADLLYEGEPSDIAVGAAFDRATGRTFVRRAPDFYTDQTFEVDGADLVKIDVPDSATTLVWRDWLIVRPREPWPDGTFPAGAILAAPYEPFQRGEAQLSALFTPSASESVVDLTVTEHHLILTILTDVVHRLEIHTPQDGAWRARPLELTGPADGERPIAAVAVRAVDAVDSDDLWVTTESFAQPTTLAHARLDASGEVRSVEPLKHLPAFFDAAGVTVSQHFATSRDGTRVPYFQISPAGVTTDASNPTLLYGYGGFEVSLTPSYLAVAGKAWVERGGVYVIANIRGGGEYGPAWHRAALKADRHRAYEDFAAVAADLVARSVTTPEHLGIQGGSNGGLLVGNMVTGYPELFGAAVCQVPLLDMRRFNRLLAGASWMAEYGDPDDAEQWEFIKTFSPLHRFDPDRSYPPVLFTTSTKDDRVHPAHARTLAHEMLAAGKDVTYFENIEGGHGGAATNAQRAMMQAFAYEFLWQRLG